MENARPRKKFSKGSSWPRPIENALVENKMPQSCRDFIYRL